MFTTCQRCRRQLKSAESQRIGFGPTCRPAALRTLMNTKTLFTGFMLPSFTYHIREDIIIIYDLGGAVAVLQDLAAIFDRLNQDLPDAAQEFLVLVKGVNGLYDGLVPDPENPGQWKLAPIGETDEERARKKLLHFHDLGDGTRPAM